MQPPKTYKHQRICPSLNELLGECGPLRKNIIKGKFASPHEYLDIQFSLLREDFVACLRQGLKNHRSGEVTKEFDVYPDITMYKGRNKRNVEVLKVRIPSQKEDSKKFMTGSLLLFTKDNFESGFMATVVCRDMDEATIHLVDMNNNRVMSRSTFTMAESGAYFDPYFQVLSVLQTMPTDNFPMEKYIVEVDTASVYIPRYLLSNQTYHIGNHRLTTSMIPKCQGHGLNLNKAQLTAFRAALSQEFVVIQGPPGTGKTFLGLKIAETLIRNSHFWYKNSPILVVSQKNYALDQFLEGLVPITDKLVRVGGQSKSDVLRKYNLNYESGNAIGRRPDPLQTMKQALVVGMTTSLAARWRSHLENLRCPIVIVEEAAEVLEGHVVASLTPHCQHLILLGDHAQLQPITSNYDLGRKYHLGVSLFERMINNGIQCYQLNVQHRMRPEISDLLRAKIYPFLQDHESVLGRPSILGVDRNVFFLNHRWSEESAGAGGTSKKNFAEAVFVVMFARHLALNGYDKEKVVILTPYAGQLPELEQLVNKLPELEGVKVMSLDAFQGREADVVLLSLVANSSVGFLHIQNRVCVGLSRARNGFYMFGNVDMLAKKSDVWYKVKKCLQQQKSLGDKLPLRCQMHPSTVTQVGCAEDFSHVYDGGCWRKCQFNLSCGHKCRLLCHTKYKKHTCKHRCKKDTLNPASYASHQGYQEDALSNSPHRTSSYNYIDRVTYWQDRNRSILRIVLDWVVSGWTKFWNWL